MKKFKKLIDQYITPKFSKRAFYGHGKKYQQTNFTPGSKYVVDVKNNKIVIMSPDGHDDLKPRKVSKRGPEDNLIPVIDVKDRKSIEAFEGVEYLEIKVYEDEIIVEGYVAEDKQSTSQRTSKQTSKKITSIRDFMKVRKVTSASISYDQLKMAAGGGIYQQSIFDVFESKEREETIESSVSSSVSTVLKGLGIPLTVASFFSGAGMLDLAFKESGFEILCALDRNAGDEKGCLDTYRHNIGNHAIEADIKAYDFSKLPKVSVAIAGVDCKAYSNVNRQTRLLDHPNNDLFRYYLKAIKETEADIFLIENVPAFLTSFNGEIGKEIREEMKGFEISAGVLNARDFGSAQDRKRAILIGSRIGKIELPFHTVKEPKTVAQAFEGLHDGIPNQLEYSKPKTETLERMKHVPPGGNWRNIPDHLKTKKMGDNTQSNVYHRLDPNKHSCTMVNVRKSNITHPWENRSLSVRESARLQDLPDHFVFKGTRSSQQAQVANGVPFSLGKAIATQIKRHIEKFGRKVKEVTKGVTSTFGEGANGQLALF
ncbi:DNA cytosine methyltransferase (plasmid) [Rossellomorea sp. AcN35-11]|nr:DNA cytosine methyltransferase [Rossellomorea sp. AcN35-11]